MDQAHPTRVQVLRSGSGGNAIFVEVARTRLLIDVGLPLEGIVRLLAPLSLTPSDLSAVLLTHEHDDHARGAGSLSRAAGIPVLANERTLARAAPFLGGARTERFTTGIPFAVGEIQIDPFPVPHDAAEPVGFLLTAGGIRIVVAYDLGEASDPLRERLPSADLILLEANYDPRLLGVGTYPWFLKNRILGGMGHLSNDRAAEAVVRAARGGRAQTVLLIHLSDVNNLLPLARDTVRWALEREGIAASRVEAVRSNGAGPLWEATAGAVGLPATVLEDAAAP
ncbi:MAG: MBL fold metallo-hydrolase [Armatimonadetes bacterium]|nr:MBL fold metallo-hydrolase [Armatimonadota bacterium]